MLSRKLYGKLAEYIATIFLLIKLYKIEQRNFNHSSGEVDIIALKKDTLVFIEVKIKTSATEPISYKQQQRIKQGAIAFISKNPLYQNLSIRFDLIQLGPGLKIQHILNAW